MFEHISTLGTYWSFTTELLLCPVFVSFIPVRGLLVMDSRWAPPLKRVYKRSSVASFDSCREPDHGDRHPSLRSEPCGAFLGDALSPRCNWSVCRDCVLSLLNVRWNSSCWQYSSTYLMDVNNVFKATDWMLVLWDHGLEHCLTLELRGPELAETWTELCAGSV